MNLQAIRVKPRDVGNLVFITHTLQGVVQLITGTMIRPQTPVVIIGSQHELRLECEQPFLLCPADAKKHESSLHQMNTDLQKEFERTIQNLNRFVLKKDQNGRPTNSRNMPGLLWSLTVLCSTSGRDMCSSMLLPKRRGWKSWYNRFRIQNYSSASILCRSCSK
jgi:hypothetical protein